MSGMATPSEMPKDLVQLQSPVTGMGVAVQRGTFADPEEVLVPELEDELLVGEVFVGDAGIDTGVLCGGTADLDISDAGTDELVPIAADDDSDIDIVIETVDMGMVMFVVGVTEPELVGMVEDGEVELGEVELGGALELLGVPAEVEVGVGRTLVVVVGLLELLVLDSLALVEVTLTLVLAGAVARVRLTLGMEVGSATLVVLAGAVLVLLLEVSLGDWLVELCAAPRYNTIRSSKWHSNCIFYASVQRL